MTTHARAYVRPGADRPLSGAVSWAMCALVFLTVGCANEEAAWKAAKGTGTIQAYEEFLKSYPAEHFAGEAQAAIAALSWDQTKTTHTQQAYQTFLKRFPKSAFEGEAALRSRDFVVRAVGTGEISLPGNQRTVRRGPVLELSPQWATRLAKVNNASSYATDGQGNRMSMLYLVPVDLASHEARTEKLSDGAVGQETWIPPVNTFTRRYNAFGTVDNAIGFVFEFGDDKTPVRFGLVYDKDHESIVTLHILDNVITLRP